MGNMFDRWIKRKRWTRGSKTLFWSCKYSEPKLEINAYSPTHGTCDSYWISNSIDCFGRGVDLMRALRPTSYFEKINRMRDWEQVACPVNNTVIAIFALKLWKSGYKCFYWNELKKYIFVMLTNESAGYPDNIPGRKSVHVHRPIILAWSYSD